MNDNIKKYEALLNFFSVSGEGLLRTRHRYVEIDDIHNAVIALGVDMTEDFRYYVYKTKKIALERIRKETHRGVLFKKYFNILEYDEMKCFLGTLSEEEKTYVVALIKGDHVDKYSYYLSKKLSAQILAKVC